MGRQQPVIGLAEPLSGTQLSPVYHAVLGAVCFVAAGASAFAQEDVPEQQRAWTIAPRVSVQETFTDNANLTPNGQSNWVTDIAPGVRIYGRSKRLKLNLDYSIHQFLYAQGSQSEQTQQSLNTRGSLEAVENLLFVDMSGSIMRQNVSAFGTPSASNYSVNSNSTETSTYQISPYIKGRLGSYVNYLGRYSKTTVSAKASAVPRSDSEVWSGELFGDTPLAALGWSVNANRQSANYTVGRSSDADSLRGMLTYRVTPQLRLSMSAGEERNNYVSENQETNSTHGYGFDWRPTERTQVSGFKEKRFFGDGHTFSLSHRMPQSSVRYNDSRDVSIMPNQNGTVFTTLYDALLVLKQDPASAATASGILDSPQLSALAQNTLVSASLLTGQATIQRRQELTYILLGARNSLTLTVLRSRDQRLGTFVFAGVDLSNASTSSLIQRGVVVGLSHQLSGLSTLHVNASQSRNNSGNDLGASTSQKALSTTVSSRLGARTSGSVTARRTVTSSAGGFGNSYTENAVSGMVSVEF